MTKKSLQEQLLKAGLIDKKRADQAKKQQKQAQRQKKGKKNASKQVDESKQAAELAALEKAKADRALNAEQQRQAQAREKHHQISQIIKSNRIELKEGDTPYRFVDGHQVQMILVDTQCIHQLAEGKMVIVKWQNSYHVIADAAAQRIEKLTPEILIKPAEKTQEALPEHYAKYVIPDDLMW